MNFLRHICFSALGFVVLLGVGSAHAQQVGQGGCIQDAIGQIVCAPPGGGIMANAIGQIVCGRRQCVQNAIGQIVCSSQPGGYAMVNAIGQVVCTGGCESASSSICQRPR